jgi:hypothetical protein
MRGSTALSLPVPLGATTLSLTIFSIKTLSIMGLFATLCIECYYAKYRYAQCHVSFFVMMKIVAPSFAR